MDKPILGLVAEQCAPKSLSKLSCSAGDEHYIPAAQFGLAALCPDRRPIERLSRSCDHRRTVDADGASDKVLASVILWYTWNLHLQLVSTSSHPSLVMLVTIMPASRSEASPRIFDGEACKTSPTSDDAQIGHPTRAGAVYGAIFHESINYAVWLL